MPAPEQDAPDGAAPGHRRGLSRGQTGRSQEPVPSPSPDAAAGVTPADLIAVGRVVDAYGTRGWVKIECFNRPEESVLLACRRWWLPDGRSLRVQSVRQHASVLVGKPAEFTDRDHALSLKGLEIRVSRSEFPVAADGEYYWVDLEGCEVRNREGASLGQVVSVVDHGAHPILIVQDGEDAERLIPFVDAYVLDVELAARRILVDWQPDY